MRARTSTIVGTLIRRHPEVEDILGWYGINPTNGELGLTLAEICRAYWLDLEDVLDDEDEDEEGEDDEEDGEEDGAVYVESWGRASDDEGSYDEADEGPWQNDRDDDRWLN